MEPPAMLVTLRDLLARDMHLEWFEGVAIVQALCQRLMDSAPGNGAGVPDLEDIVVTPDGTVDVKGGGPPGQAPVFRIGWVLTALVPGEQMPASLRLLALSAVSPAPSCASVKELTTALEYYERPGRADILRDLYERCAKQPGSPEAPAALEEIPAAPPPVAAHPASRWTRRRVVVAASLALVAAGGALWLARGPGGAWVVGGSRRAVQLVATTKGAVTSGVETLRTRFRKPAPAEALPATAAAPATVAPPQAVARARRTAASPGEFVGPRRAAAEASPAAALPALGQAVVPETAPPPVAATEVDDVIYTERDRDVVPPAFVRQRLPAVPSGVATTGLPLMELVVSARGEVESVRLDTVAPDVRTSMMISAAKAWRFVPATRDGRPVRYRYAVRLTTR